MSQLTDYPSENWLLSPQLSLNQARARPLAKRHLNGAGCSCQSRHFRIYITHNLALTRCCVRVVLLLQQPNQNFNTILFDIAFTQKVTGYKLRRGLHSGNVRGSARVASMHRHPPSAPKARQRDLHWDSSSSPQLCIWQQQCQQQNHNTQVNSFLVVAVSYNRSMTSPCRPFICSFVNCISLNSNTLRNKRTIAIRNHRRLP